MKKLFIIFILLSSYCFIFADDFRGVFGAEFGNTPEEVRNVLLEKGFSETRTTKSGLLATEDYPKDTTILTFKKNNATYGGVPFGKLILVFYPEDKLSQIFFTNIKLDKDFVNRFTEKYEFVSSENPFIELYHSTNGTSLLIMSTMWQGQYDLKLSSKELISYKNKKSLEERQKQEQEQKEAFENDL